MFSQIMMNFSRFHPKLLLNKNGRQFKETNHMVKLFQYVILIAGVSLLTMKIYI